MPNMSKIASAAWTRSGLVAIILAIIPFLVDPARLSESIVGMLQGVDTTSGPAPESNLMYYVLSIVSAVLIIYARALPPPKK